MKNLLIREVHTEGWEIVSDHYEKTVRGTIVIKFVSDNKFADFLDSGGYVNEFELIKAIYNSFPESIEV